MRNKQSHLTNRIRANEKTVFIIILNYNFANFLYRYD